MKIIDLDIHSPVQQINHPVFTEQDLNVLIKRDDLIHPLISGNKWRKLKYVLRKAQTEDKTHLVTFGGAYSNHLLATAAAAALFGFQSTGFVRGEEVNNSHLLLCRLHGMHLIFVDRESYRDKEALFNKYYFDDVNACFIDEGGASPEATLGCSELINELPQVYDHLFCAAGTGTTAAGILNGITTNKLNTQLHVVPVFKNGGFISNEIDQYLTIPSPYQLHLDYHFGGYAKTTPQLIEFIKSFVSDAGILIEPVYTGKMLYALFDLAKAGYFKRDSSILAIHTGGILGLLGMGDKFTL